MTQSLPRTTASHETDSFTDRRNNGYVYESPHARLTVEWSWGDGPRALELLHTAYEDVRSQIEQTMPPAPKPRTPEPDTSARAMLDERG